MKKAQLHVRQRGPGCTGLDNPEEPLKCVFSSVSEIKIGTGTTTKKQNSKLLWFVKQQDIDEFGVRKINTQFVPVGEPEIIDRETLLTNYEPEVELHNSQVYPAMQTLRKRLAKGDKYREQGKPLSAEMEYSEALNVDETNIRAIFGLGLVYLAREEAEKSQTVFNQLISMEAAFSVTHKHLFNEFGIALRKAGLYAEAVEYYTKAVDMGDEDDNLFYNLSRAHYENNDWDKSIEFAARALKLNPEHQPSMSICGFTLKLAGDDALRIRHGKPPVPEEAAKRAEILFNLDEEYMQPMGETPLHAPDEVGE